MPEVHMLFEVSLHKGCERRACQTMTVKTTVMPRTTHDGRPVGPSRKNLLAIDMLHPCINENLLDQIVNGPTVLAARTVNLTYEHDSPVELWVTRYR